MSPLSRGESGALRCLAVGSIRCSSSSINIRGRRTCLQLCTQWRMHSSGRTRRTLVLSCGLCSILMHGVQSWQKGWNSILKLVACVSSNIKPKRSTQGMVTDSDFLRLRSAEYVDTRQKVQDQDMESTVKGELIHYWKSQLQLDVMPFKDIFTNTVKKKLSSTWIWKSDNICMLM